jgi:hypothetical protein
MLVCGIVAGPLYIAVTAIQALTRAGFDPSHHRYNLLTTGDLGWIHRTNYVVAGVLTVLFAVGARQMLAHGRGTRWGPRLLALYGLAYISSGVFPADPVLGFPPGTLSESTTWHGAAQMASRSASSAALVAASLVFARSRHFHEVPGFPCTGDLDVGVGHRAGGASVPTCGSTYRWSSSPSR